MSFPGIARIVADLYLLDGGVMVWQVCGSLWHALKLRPDSQLTAGWSVSPCCIALDHLCSIALVACISYVRRLGGLVDYAPSRICNYDSLQLLKSEFLFIVELEPEAKITNSDSKLLFRRGR